METPETPTTTNLHLLIKLQANGLYAAAFDPLEDDTYRCLANIFSGQETDEALKNRIYENPQLLQEYGRTCILVDSPHFTFVPEEIEPAEENRRDYYDFCFPDHTDYIVENRLQHNRAYSLFGIGHDLYGFLCRTFPTAAILHPLTPLCEYFALNSRNGNEAKVYLHIQENHFCLIVFKQGRLLFANRFDGATADDIAYYTLQVYKQLSLDRLRDRIYLTGSKTMRPVVTALLQEYVQAVLPYPFPSQLFRLGKETLDAPFDLITIPLCGL